MPSIDATAYQAQQGGSAGDPDAARALEIAGYPSLLQEYLWQQHQQQRHDRAAAAAIESRLALSNQWGNFGNHNNVFGSQGLNFGGGSGHAELERMNQQQQQMNSNQLLLQTVQATNGIPSGLPPGLPAGVWSNSSPFNNEADQFALNGILGPWSERSAGLLGSMVATGPVSKPIKVKKGRRKQPKDKPKRPLSAYNIFFKEERARLLQKLEDSKQEKPPEEEESDDKKTPSKIGFENLAKIIGSKWQDLTPPDVEYYKGKAEVDMKRYKSEMETYLAKQSVKDNDGVEGQDDEASEEPTPKKQKL